jgi:hypothetical protein
MMLAQSLKELEASGIVHREQSNEVPPRVEYTLTDKGKSIIPHLVKLAEWSAGHMQENKTFAAFCATCKSMKYIFVWQRIGPLSIPGCCSAGHD